MAINRNNYEAYFIDYHEGRLPEELADELMVFLEANPDLKSAFDDFEAVTLEPDTGTVFRGKSSLRRSETTGISLADEAAIARLEGDHAGVDIPDAEIVKLLALFHKTKLQPDPGIKYPLPQSLKKRSAFTIPAGMRYAAAAAILLLLSFGAWLMFSPSAMPERQTYELAKLEKHDAGLETANILPAHLALREQETMVLSMPVADRVELAAMEENSAGMISPPAGMGSSSTFMLPRYAGTMAAGYEELAYMGAREEKTLAGKVIAGIFNKVKVQTRRDNQRNKEGKGDGFSFWDLAELGVKGVNILGDHDYTLVRDYNEKGNVTGVVIVAE
jgi:hypothetical protein